MGEQNEQRVDIDRVVVAASDGVDGYTDVDERVRVGEVLDFSLRFGNVLVDHDDLSCR